MDGAAGAKLTFKVKLISNVQNDKGQSFISWLLSRVRLTSLTMVNF